MSDRGRPKRIRRWLAYLGAAVLLWTGAESLFDFFPEQKKEFRRSVRTAVESTFPGQAAKVASSYGLSSYGEPSGKGPGTDLPTHAVVLIHGLDDPGKVWMNLGPALIQEGENVLEMRYPNDQPIADSARLFYREMGPLRQRGVRRIAIVGHSMGGLVAREMLTNPRLAYDESTRAGETPEVSGLIMVGTPNHGSEMARFRVLNELRDQWVHMQKGQGHLLRGILDGAGEAKVDLLPDSRFLRALNERPHPDGVRMLVIAGIASPWNRDDINRLIDSARDRIPGSRREALQGLEAVLMSMTDGLGDGLVTVESTRLDGIDHRTVRGTHLSMIRNLRADSGRVPPAVPVILGALEKSPSGSSDTPSP